MTVVYGDVLFVINFSMDFIALFLTAQILHIPVRGVRLACAAAMGGVYGVAAIFLPGGRALGIPLSLLLCAGMCLCAFGYGAARRFLLSLLLFFAAGATLSGGMTAAMTLIGRVSPVAGVSGTLSPRVFAVTAAAAAALTFLSGRLFSSGGREKTVRLRITCGERQCDCLALVDSGNLVKEPVSGRPAILLRMQDAATLFPQDLYAALSCEPFPLERLTSATLRRTRLLPVAGVGGRRLLAAYLPDRVEILGKRRARTVDAVLTADPSGTERYGDAEAVLPASLLV